MSRGDKPTNNLSAIYSTVNIKYVLIEEISSLLVSNILFSLRPTPPGPSGDHYKNNTSETQTDKNGSSVKNIEEQKADLAKRLQKYSLIQKSDSYERLVGEVRNFLCGSFDNLTRPLTQRSSSVDVPRT